MSGKASALIGSALLALVAAAPALAQGQPQGAGVIALDGSTVPGGVATQEGAEPHVYFAAPQRSAVGEIDPSSRTVSYIPLGHGAKPRSVTICPNGNLYALDPALNVIHEITPATEQVRRHPMPGQNVDLLGAICTASNTLIFTGYAGWLGKLDTGTGQIMLVEAHGGRGPGAIALAVSGIAGTGAVWFASYASNQLVRVDPVTMRQDPFAMPRGVEGPKGVAIDQSGRVWVTAFRSQRVARFDPRRRGWDGWSLGEGARPHAILIERSGAVLISDVGRDRLLRLDPATGGASVAASLTEKGQARAMARLGDQVWLSESAADRIRVIDAADRPTN